MKAVAHPAYGGRGQTRTAAAANAAEAHEQSQTNCGQGDASRAMWQPSPIAQRMQSCSLN